MMATVASTVRQLKNKETNVDMYVPSFVEVPGSLLTATTHEYSLVVVSSLPAYKTKTHGFKDTVQFVVKKRYSDFEALRAQLDAKYSATILPFLPKRLILADDRSNAAERLAACDRLMRSIARDPKLCSCSIVLTFLGIALVGSGRAKSDDDEATLDMEDVAPPAVQADHDAASSIQAHPLSSMLDESAEDSDLFAADGEDVQQSSADNDNFSDRDRMENPDQTSGDMGVSRASGLKMFARLNLDDPALDAVIPPPTVSHRQLFDDEDDSTSDLLRVNELDDLLASLTKKPPSSSSQQAQIASQTSAEGWSDPGRPNIPVASALQDNTEPVLENMASNDILRYIAEHNVGTDHNSDDDLFS